jgi:nucleoside-diphosphate-sugar epimerase
MSHLCCMGMGYVAHHVARQMEKNGFEISGTHRINTPPFGNWYQASRLDQETTFFSQLECLRYATHLLITIPPTERGDWLLERMEPLLHEAPVLNWVGYISSTGVYGDSQGRWVDEDSPLCPISREGIRRMKAENQWIEFAKTKDVPISIFRLAALYGPSRCVLDGIRQGTAKNIFTGEVVQNRIHINDATDAICAAQKTQSAGYGFDVEFYNLTDDQPSCYHDVIAYACDLLNVPCLPHVEISEANVGLRWQQFLSQHKRVSNRKMRGLLQRPLHYPTYQEGLVAILSYEKKVYLHKLGDTNY